MKLNKDFILILYLFPFVSFIFSILLFIPRPKLNQYAPNISKNDQLNVSRLYIKKNRLSNRLKRKINIGNSYLLVFDNKTILKLTPLSFSTKTKFDLSYYSKYLSELIINADEIKSINQNNYGIKRRNLEKNYQACLYDFKKTSFIYKLNNDEIVYRYNDFRHWFSVINKEILELIKGSSSKDFNCLLITTTNPEIFENDNNNILKIISKNFFYE